MSQIEDWTTDFPTKLIPIKEEPIERPTERPNVLYVRDFSRQSEPIDPKVIGFSNHHKLGSFRIDGNQSYDDSDCRQNLIKDTIDFEDITKMSINLMEGLTHKQLISRLTTNCLLFKASKTLRLSLTTSHTKC